MQGTAGNHLPRAQHERDGEAREGEPEMSKNEFSVNEHSLFSVRGYDA